MLVLPGRINSPFARTATDRTGQLADHCPNRASKKKHSFASRAGHVLGALGFLIAFASPAAAAIIVEPKPITVKADTQIHHRAMTEDTVSVLPRRKPKWLASAKLDKQSRCLALAIYYEARGESELGQIAIAQVVLNRVKSRKYPGTICKVVYENSHMRNRCQFSFTCDGRPENPRHRVAWGQAKSLAVAIYCRKDCDPDARQDSPLSRLDAKMRRASHYHATYVAPRWSRRLKRTGKIGQHIFYISARAWL